MLFQYAQNFTDYALNYAPNLSIMLKLCWKEQTCMFK